ncbi:hypothetical protein [Metallosphaera hakonensis]|uniref:hypothetical protein n=1 Tax=Metallosphaera hakonensis TaxID=79601 RepID=UPI0020922FFE|nr:hypothetical protein [Metallosphaera hakonensis]
MEEIRVRGQRKKNRVKPEEVLEDIEKNKRDSPSSETDGFVTEIRWASDEFRSKE